MAEPFRGIVGEATETLDLDTTPARYVAWIGEYLRQEAETWPPPPAQRLDAPQAQVGSFDGTIIRLCSHVFCTTLTRAFGYDATETWTHERSAEVIRLELSGENPITVKATCYYPEMVGGLFERLLAQSRQRWQAVPESTPEPNHASEPEMPAWFPKKWETRAKWREALQLIQERLQESRDAYDEGEADDVRVTNADLQDVLANGMGWKPDVRVITDIKRAGKMNLLG
jgi:hypothetical protein